MDKKNEKKIKRFINTGRIFSVLFTIVILLFYLPMEISITIEDNYVNTGYLLLLLLLFFLSSCSILLNGFFRRNKLLSGLSFIIILALFLYHGRTDYFWFIFIIPFVLGYIGVVGYNKVNGKIPIGYFGIISLLFFIISFLLMLIYLLFIL